MQGCDIGGKMSDGDLSNISDLNLSKFSHSNSSTKREWSWAVNIFVPTSN